MTEGKFCSSLLRDLREAYPSVIAHQHWTSIPSSNARFQPRNPYDFYVVFEGRFLAVEAKQIKGRSLPVGKYRFHQTEALLDVIKSDNGDAWYLVNIRELLVEKAPEELREFRYGKRVLACAVVAPFEMDAMVEQAKKAGRKSIPVEAVVENAHAFFGRAKKGWDVEGFVNICYSGRCCRGC